jgi:hypothetical protein
MPKISKLVKRESAIQIIGGLEKYYRGQTAIYVGGKKYTQPQLISLFRSLVDAIDEVNALQASVVAAVARERNVASTVRELTRLLKITVDAGFGFSPIECGDFGWTMPKKPGPKTVQAKLEGARKSQETRKARQTMGKRQRKRIRGW